MKNKHFKFIIFSLILLLSLTSCTLKLPSKGRAYFVGIALDYKNTTVNTLNGTIDDSIEVGTCYRKAMEARGHEVIEKYLIASGEDANKLGAEYPSKAHILSAIENLPATKDDLVFVYYSGHGAIDNVNHASYLITGKVSDEPFETLSTAELAMAVDRLPSANVIFLDSCYSGGIVQYGQIDLAQASVSFFEKHSFRQIQLISACSADQLSYEMSVSGEKHGRATTALLATLGWSHSTESSHNIVSNGTAHEVKGERLYETFQPAENVTAGKVFEKMKETLDGIQYSYASNYHQKPLCSVGESAIVLLPRK